MTFSELIRENIRFVIIFPLFVAAGALVGSLFVKPMYRSSTSLMIVQKQNEEIDAQAAVRSAEQMADILSRVAGSEVFREAVLASNEVNVDLPSRPWERAKKWNKIVKTKNITDTGILVVDVYQPTSAGATKLASVVQNVLTSRGYDYLGADNESVLIRQLNSPSPTNNKPATPNIPVNTAIGFLSGLIAAFTILLLFPNFSLKRSNRGPKNSQNFVNSESNAETSGMFYSPKLNETIKTVLETPLEVVEAPQNTVSFVDQAESMLKRQF